MVLEKLLGAGAKGILEEAGSGQAVAVVHVGDGVGTALSVSVGCYDTTPTDGPNLELIAMALEVAASHLRKRAGTPRPKLRAVANPEIVTEGGEDAADVDERVVTTLHQRGLTTKEHDILMAVLDRLLEDDIQ